jgi:hypothetical protein
MTTLLSLKSKIIGVVYNCCHQFVALSNNPFPVVKEFRLSTTKKQAKCRVVSIDACKESLSPMFQRQHTNSLAGNLCLTANLALNLLNPIMNKFLYIM